MQCGSLIKTFSAFSVRILKNRRMLLEKEKKNENTKCKRNTRGKSAERVFFKRSRKDASVTGPLISDYFKG